MWRLVFVLLFVLASPVPAQAPAPLGEVLDEIVAVVGDRVLTQSDLELEARVVLVSGGGADAAYAALDAEAVRSVLEYVVNQLLIVGEADRLQVFEVPPEEVSLEVERFAAQLPGQGGLDGFLASQDVTLKRVASIFRRNLRVKRYLDSRVKLTVRVEDGEIEAFYAQNQRRFAGRPLSAVRDVIRGYLFKQRYEEMVRRMVEELRGRGSVRLLVEPRPIPAALEPAIAPAAEAVVSEPAP